MKIRSCFGLRDLVSVTIETREKDHIRRAVSSMCRGKTTEQPLVLLSCYVGA